MRSGSRRGLVLTGLAAVTPVGFSAGQSCASLRAGINRIREHPFYTPSPPHPPLPEPRKALSAAIPVPGVESPLSVRLMELAVLATKELFPASGLKRQDLAATGFLLNLPETSGKRPVLDNGPGFANQLLERLAIQRVAMIRVREDGHTGMLTMLAEAENLLAQGACEVCVIGGVDSYLNRPTMTWLDETFRLKSERNIDGFIPGEAATFFLVEDPAHARARGAIILGRVLGGGSSMEPDTIWSDRNSSGQGLTEVIRQSVDAAGVAGSSWTICDLNGESYRAREWGVVQVRLAECFDAAHRLWHPSDCIGDVGAATGGLHVAMACRAFARRYAPSQHVLLWSASDDGKRAACIIGGPN